MDAITVLVTSSGTSSAINVIKSLKLQTEFNISIIAVDVDNLAAGLRLADYYYISPPITRPDDYLEFLYGICKKHNVRVLCPCYSKELSLISKAIARFSELGVAMLLSSPNVIDLCNDKLHLLDFIEDIGIPTPKIFTTPNESHLPLFSKRVEGSGSRGAIYIENEHILKGLLASPEQRFYQEFIEGDEYTVDVLCDRESNVLFVGPRRRIEIKAGQSVKGVTIHNEILEDYVERICTSVGIVGVCNIQFIEKDGTFYFIELNPRYAAGGLMLTVHAGANLPLAALKVALGLPIDKSELKHTPNVTMIRYWEEAIIKERIDVKTESSLRYEI